MRKRLKEEEGVRTSFQGTFIRCGSKRGGDTTVLLRNIRQNNKKVTDHAWFNLTDGFKSLFLCPGDVVYFDCRVKEYTKGYKGKNTEKQKLAPVRKDYKLNYPTNLSKDWTANSQSNKILRFFGGTKNDWIFFEEFQKSRNSVEVAKNHNISVDKCWEKISRCQDVCFLKPIKRCVILSAIAMKKDMSFVNRVLGILEKNNITVRNFGEFSKSDFNKLKGAGKQVVDCLLDAQNIFLGW